MSALEINSNNNLRASPLHDENEDENEEYLIDSEDSEEEGEDEQEIKVSLPISRLVTIEDLEELRSKTVDLLDPTWKKSRNKHLIRKMLELEEPVITSQVRY